MTFSLYKRHQGKNKLKKKLRYAEKESSSLKLDSNQFVTLSRQLHLENKNYIKFCLKFLLTLTFHDCINFVL